MISLADVRARNVQPSWQEAVSVIQELIQTVSATSPLPDLEHIALCPNGDVVALPGSPVPSDPVHHAAEVLKVLVEGVATPPELERFLERNLTTPPQIGSIAEFSRNLAFFERPGRRSDVERLANAAVAGQLTRADDELKRLIEKVNEADPKTSKDMFPQGQRTLRRVLPVLVVGVLVVGAVALAALWWRTRMREAQPAQSTTAQAGDAHGARGGTAAPPTDRLKPRAPTTAIITEMETRGGSAYREAPGRGKRAQTNPELKNLPPVAALAPMDRTAAAVEISSIEVGGTKPVVTLPPATREGSPLSPPRRLFEKESTALERVLVSYAQAYNRLDVNGAVALWPSADSRALARAFARLQHQDLKFDNCMFAVSENDGTAQCAGVLQYVRRIGKPTPQIEHHVWTIEFARAGEEWRIVRVTAQ